MCLIKILYLFFCLPPSGFLQLALPSSWQSLSPFFPSWRFCLHIASSASCRHDLRGLPTFLLPGRLFIFLLPAYPLSPHAHTLLTFYSSVLSRVYFFNTYPTLNIPVTRSVHSRNSTASSHEVHLRRHSLASSFFVYNPIFCSVRQNSTYRDTIYSPFLACSNMTVPVELDCHVL